MNKVKATGLALALASARAVGRSHHNAPILPLLSITQRLF